MKVCIRLLQRKCLVLVKLVCDNNVAYRFPATSYINVATLFVQPPLLPNLLLCQFTRENFRIVSCMKEAAFILLLTHVCADSPFLITRIGTAHVVRAQLKLGAASALRSQPTLHKPSSTSTATSSCNHVVSREPEGIHSD